MPHTRRAQGTTSLHAHYACPLTYLPQLQGGLSPIYLLVGEDDRAPEPEENQEFAEELKAWDASYEFNNLPGRHGWDFWRAHLPDFLVFASERPG